ncbi:Jerky protein [Trichinella sp. T8]|nr:Jerky protein [Trichinella sp. T8]
MSVSREGKILSLEQKIEMCKLVERGESFRKIAESLGVDLSTVSDIYCSRRQLTDFVFHMDTSNSCSSRIKRALDRPISGPILQEKALAFSPKLGIDNFVASPGWLKVGMAYASLKFTVKSCLLIVRVSENLQGK